MGCNLVFSFFEQKTACEMRIRYWSSDVCSSNLGVDPVHEVITAGAIHLPIVGKNLIFRKNFFYNQPGRVARQNGRSTRTAGFKFSAQALAIIQGPDRKSTRLNSSH